MEPNVKVSYISMFSLFQVFNYDFVTKFFLTITQLQAQ